MIPTSAPSTSPSRAVWTPLPDETLRDLRIVRRWTLYFSVVGWIGAVLSGAAGASLMLVALLGDRPESSILRLVAYVYMASFFVGSAPSLLLWRYSRSLKNLNSTNAEKHLLAALHHERRLWKLIAISIVIVILGILIAVATSLPQVVENA